MPFNREQLCFVNFASAELTNRLKRTHDRQIFAVVMTGLDRAAIDKNGRDIEPGHCQHRPRHILVAAANSQHTIQTLTRTDGLNGIRNHLPRHQGILHPLGAHRYTIADGDRAKQLRHRPSRPQSGLGPQGEIIDAHIAGCNRTKTVRNTNNGLAKVIVTKANGP